MSETSSQDELDSQIRAYYGDVFDENARLSTRSAQGPLEFDRVQTLIRENVGQKAHIIDIGGGAGAHAAALNARGHDVVLIDPVPEHIVAAQRAGIDARVADARDLPFADDSFDAAIMLGPLYHLADAVDRRRAIDEAIRATRADGVIFAGAISRYIAFGQIFLVRDPAVGDPDEWVALLRDGRPSPRMRFPAGHFHTAESLERELTEAGLVDVVVHGVEGPAGMLLEGLPVDTDKKTRDAAAHLAAVASATPGIRDFSGHLLAVARVKDI